MADDAQPSCPLTFISPGNRSASQKAVVVRLIIFFVLYVSFCKELAALRRVSPSFTRHRADGSLQHDKKLSLA